MEHYFTNNSNLKSNIQEFKVKVFDKEFVFKTDNGVFSKGELDYGTRLLIETVLKLDITGKGLDLGCGYGAIGIIVSCLKNLYVSMLDVNKRAIHLADMNIKENNCLKASTILNDGLENIEEKYDFIISNPPIRVGKKKLYELLEDALLHLKKNGSLYVVIRKEQGAKSFIRDFQDKSKIEVLNKSKGFYIISLKCC